MFTLPSIALEAGEPIPMDHRARSRWDLVWASQACIEAADKLMAASGGSAFYDREPMQRFFRDSRIAGNHAHLNLDKGAPTFGLFSLGGQVLDYTY